MHDTYQAFLDRMIHRYEGGYGWDKGDAGGPTKYGITCWDLAEHRGQKMNSMRAWAPIVKAMTLDEAEAIYWTKYALGLRYNDLPAGVDVVMLDYGVNSGVSRPITVARTLLKLSAGSTSKVDDVLLGAINRAGPAWFIKAMDTERLGFMHRIKGGAMWHTFGKGWGARVSDLDLYALALTKQAPLPVPPVPDSLPKSSAKAVHPEPSATKHVGTGVSGALSTALAGHVAGVPMSYLIVLVLAAVGAGVAYYFYQKYLSAKVNAVVIAVEGKTPTGTTGPTGK